MAARDRGMGLHYDKVTEKNMGNVPVVEPVAAAVVKYPADVGAGADGDLGSDSVCDRWEVTLDAEDVLLPSCGRVRGLIDDDDGLNDLLIIFVANRPASQGVDVPSLQAPLVRCRPSR